MIVLIVIFGVLVYASICGLACCFTKPEPQYRELEWEKTRRIYHSRWPDEPNWRDYSTRTDLK